MLYTNLENLVDWENLVKEIRSTYGAISVTVDNENSETVPKTYLLKHLQKNLDNYHFNFLPPTPFWKENNYNLKDISFEALENIPWADAYKLVETTDPNILEKRIVKQNISIKGLDHCLEKICKEFNVYCIDAWISIVYPCFSVPLHDDLANFNSKEGYRISIPLQDPNIYQSFIVEDQCYNDIPKYHAVRFEKHEMHGLINCSKESHYMLNITAGTF
jgi:hypothetical protein